MIDEKILVELVSKIIYYALVFILYKLLGFDLIAIYLLACLNIKLVEVIKNENK